MIRRCWPVLKELLSSNGATAELRPLSSVPKEGPIRLRCPRLWRLVKAEVSRSSYRIAELTVPVVSSLTVDEGRMGIRCPRDSVCRLRGLLRRIDSLGAAVFRDNDVACGGGWRKSGKRTLV